MKWKAALALCFAILLVGVGVLELNHEPQKGPAYTHVQTVTTPAGLSAYLVSDDTLPIVSLNVHLPAGSLYDPPDRRGLANLMARLLDEGAGDMDAAAYQERMEDLAISISVTVSRDTLSLSLRTTTDTLDQAFEMLRLALESPRFDDEAVERMRSGVLASIRYESGDPSTLASNALFARVFGDHPYAFDEKGSDASVREITREDLVAFHRARVTRETLSIGVAGDIDAKRLAALLDKTFGNLPAKAKGDAPVLPSPRFDGGMTPVPFDVPQSTVLLAQPGLLRADPDWHAYYLLNYILGGGGFQSRLMEEVREKRGLAYSVYSAVYPFDLVGLWLAGTATENARVGDSVAVIKSEWTRLAAEGPTDQEVAEAKTYQTGAWPLRFTSTSSVASMLASMKLLGLAPDYIATRNDIVEALSRQDITRVAQRVMAPDRLTGVIVGP